MRERWIVETKKADFNELGREYGVSPLVIRCMVNRGVVAKEDIDRYLNGTLADLYDPILMKGVPEAVQLLQRAVEGGEKIGVASDFDCDGIFSAYILWKGLRKVGLKVCLYTPDRVKEGYGVNERIVDAAKKEGISLLVTCDNGIAANEAVAYAKAQGMTVIVTDHHEVQEALPEADVVVDPKQAGETYPFSGLCGAGVAFKLVCALYDACAIPAEKKNELLEYVAIATVADVMELKDENRILVKYGLQALEQTDNAGLQALLEVQGLRGKKINTGHIGFILGPCFNAAGRIATVADSFDLLMETDDKKAIFKAQHLKELNKSRKAMTEEGTEQAFALLEGKTPDDIIVLLLSDVHESLVGIIAGRVKERTGHPAIIFTYAGQGMVKGSGRSIEGYDMFQELLKCKDLMTHFGGHKMAAGMTLPEENLEQLRQRLNGHSTLRQEDFYPVVRIDAAMPIGYASEKLLSEFEKMEPFGVGNPKPVFAEQHFRILRGQRLGKEKNVLKLRVENRLGSQMDALLFHGAGEFEQFIIQTFGEGELTRMYEGRENDIDVAFTYYPSINDYRGNRTIQIQISSYCRVE